MSSTPESYRRAAIRWGLVAILFGVLFVASIEPQVTFLCDRIELGLRSGSLVLGRGTELWIGTRARFHLGDQYTLTFAWFPTHRSDDFVGDQLIIPLWILVCAAALVAAWMYMRLLLFHRRKQICGNCGYDCSGVPDGAVCPECGNARVAKATAHPAEK